MDKRCFKNLKTNYFKIIISRKFFNGTRQTQAGKTNLEKS